MRKLSFTDERSIKHMVQQMKCYGRPAVALPHGPHITDALLMEAARRYSAHVGRTVFIITVKSGLNSVVVLDLDGMASRAFLLARGVNPDDPMFFEPGDPRGSANQG